MEQFRLRKGEEKFFQKFEALHQKAPFEIPKTEAKEKIKETLEVIKKEIEELPTIKQEKKYHETLPADKMTNVLAQAIKIALDEGVEKGLEFLMQTNNPYLIDAFHDLLVGHFIDLITKNK